MGRHRRRDRHAADARRCPGEERADGVRRHRRPHSRATGLARVLDGGHADRQRQPGAQRRPGAPGRDVGADPPGQRHRAAAGADAPPRRRRARSTRTSSTRCTVGDDRLRAYLRGHTDGVDKTPAWAEAITGIPAATITDLARRLRTGPHAGHRDLGAAARRARRAAVLGGDRARRLPRPDRAAAAAGSGSGTAASPAPAARTGPSGRRVRGRGANPCAGARPGGPARRRAAAPRRGLRLRRRRAPLPRRPPRVLGRRQPVPPPPGPQPARQAWQRPDTVVVHEPWWTPTARMADVVLPATTTLERDDIAARLRRAVVVAMQRALDPPGEARNDRTILAALAERLGVAEEYTGGRDDAAALRAMYERRAPLGGPARPPPARLRHVLGASATSATSCPARRPRSRRSGARPTRRRSPRRRGASSCSRRRSHGFGYDDCPGHPTWLPPDRVGGRREHARRPDPPAVAPAAHAAAQPARHGRGQRGVEGRRPRAVRR